MKVNLIREVNESARRFMDGQAYRLDRDYDVKRLLDVIPEGDLTYEGAREIAKKAKIYGVTRNQVVRDQQEFFKWEQELLELDKIEPEEFMKVNRQYSAVTHVFDMIAHGDLK